jgi:hypothetical protein
LFGPSDLLLHSAALRAVWLTGWCIRSVRYPASIRHGCTPTLPFPIIT